MQIRKLTLEEHRRTREVWEQIFTEDGPEFLDYYYDRKAAENQMYAVEKDGELISMLHLNPYLLRVGMKQVKGNYIVAVATKEKYRHQGLMAELLKQSMREMQKAKEPFTFLMPASEAIYHPFDFRFIYDQEQGESETTKIGMQESDIGVRDAERTDCAMLAEFAMRILSEKYQVYAVRDSAYYETILLERKSEAGGIRIVEKEGTLLGFFPYTLGADGCEVLEPLFVDGAEAELLQAMHEIDATVSCCAMEGSTEKRKPMIMARILHLPTFFACFDAKEEVDLIIRVTDPILEENNGTFSVKGKEQLEIKQSRENADAEFTIAGLTSFLFGYCGMDEMIQNEKSYISERGRKELKKIKVLDKVFLNEVV